MTDNFPGSSLGDGQSQMMSTSSFTQSTKISVRPSRGKGRGVFATRKIRAGEVIESAPVLLVPKSQSDAIVATFLGHYVFQTDNKKHYVIGLGLTSMLNHGEPCNAEFFVNLETITVKALRAISIGAEITIDYGWQKSDWALVGVDYDPKPPVA